MNAPRSPRAFPDALDGTVGGELDPDDEQPSLVELNAEDVMARIRGAHEAITSWEDERAALNAKIEAEFAMLEKYGVNKHAFRQARRYAKSDEKQRTGLDGSYALCRRALGQPFQEELPLGMQPATQH